MMVKNKNAWWHVRHSLWVVLSLVPLIYWLPFLHIGKKVENRKYRITGYVHLAIAICLYVGVLTPIGVACAMLSMLHSLVVFVQCLVERREYLCLLAGKEAKLHLEQTLVQEQAVQSVEAPRQETAEMPRQEAELLNVNSCTEEELCALPGISIIEAKKMTDLRQTHGDFATVEAFIAAVGIKPHVAARIVDRLYAEPTAARVAVKTASRVLDF